MPDMKTSRQHLFRQTLPVYLAPQRQGVVAAETRVMLVGFRGRCGHLHTLYNAVI